ncbi:acyl carrier protein phosphodiesterase [Niabella soli]|uniref:ACP phosphodiesterase n=1 Tax=Niabella soli DSM 19437 TaxID=929713 RepID=W0F3M5_9BACT|nr:ACP phosphodiesterase [Niabella soli]AHF16398.1 ACP phosphodiesterase [Niabella soli DSM 19437]
MNFLAHAYLSFDDEGVLAGNMISDFVKGNKQFEYPESVRAGIKLHRSIDSFTDNHPATIAAKQVFRNDYRLYSGAFMDVAYDYFLANDPQEFSAESLSVFAQKTYSTLAGHFELLPKPFQQLFYYMKTQNWLYGYRTTSGLFKSFAGLVRRAQYLTDSHPAERIFLANREFLQAQYQFFWIDLKSFTQQEFDKLLKK